MSVLEEKAQCALMEVAKRLKPERFGLPNKPIGTPERLEEPVRCGDWGRGLRAPSPCPLPQGDNPSVRCGGQLPLHRGAIRLLRRLMEKKRESGAGFGGREAAGGRAFRLAE